MDGGLKNTFQIMLTLLAAGFPAFADDPITKDMLTASPECKDGDPASDPETFLLASPRVIEVAELGPNIDAADITDLEVADFDLDGRNDVVVAWYATDFDDSENNVRVLSLYLGMGNGSFEHAADYDLYIPSDIYEALSVFRNGPADIGLGDFDGDGDPDLAVTPFFGDELWLLENLGDGTFEQHLKFPFGFNTTGNFQTPPEALAADFDGDGRDELVYIADPIQYIQGAMIHFWSTDDTIASMTRMRWEGVSDVVVQWTRGLTIADFDRDGRPDLCFSGSVNPPYEDEAVLVFWHNLNVQNRQFDVHLEYPRCLCSDVVAVQMDPDTAPGVVLTNQLGTRIEYWANDPNTPMAFHLSGEECGYSGVGSGRGMAAVLTDINNDGYNDLVTRQKLGDLEDIEQVEVTLWQPVHGRWSRVRPTPTNSFGFQDLPYSEILRPRNLAAADLCGNTLPEIIAGFGPSPIEDGENDPEGWQLRVAVWRNSCMADTSLDGRTDTVDLANILSILGGRTRPSYDPDADFNKDGVIDLGDLAILLGDYGCDCRESSMPPPE